MDVWTRLSVDVDDTGMVLGASYERHTEGEVTAMGQVRLRPDPTLCSAITDARHQVEADCGVQLLLWP